MLFRSRILLALAALGLSTSVALAGDAWRLEQPISATLHEHQFHKIVTERVGDCTVAFKLSFVAPKSGYQHPDPARDYYRFAARVSMSEGRKLFSPEFGNRAAGRRVYRWEQDTAAEGCWAEKAQKVFYVDVEGCRNRNCKIEPFK